MPSNILAFQCKLDPSRFSEIEKIVGAVQTDSRLVQLLVENRHREPLPSIKASLVGQRRRHRRQDLACRRFQHSHSLILVESRIDREQKGVVVMEHVATCERKPPKINNILRKQWHTPYPTDCRIDLCRTRPGGFAFARKVTFPRCVGQGGNNAAPTMPALRPLLRQTNFGASTQIGAWKPCKSCCFGPASKRLEKNAKTRF
ncbi:hypothetical protein ACFJIU_08020 [Mesorhizobium sp. UC74_2]|uniref:hypothetical protein n=1 Tax=Mesorhizobium sp. UC74_2 TaxID=3350171 RepID=UPI00366CCDEF